jgi:hypothetical protein
MINKRQVFARLLPALAGAAAMALKPEAASAETGPNASEAEANDAIMAWLGALQTGDPAKVEKVLAPEFQIQRSDGSGFGKSDYLKNLPKQASAPVIDKVSATVAGAELVARYVLNIRQTIEGKDVQAVAPRLSVFRKTKDGWLISAHANFAKIG